MKFRLQGDVATSTACLPEFLTLAGPERWKKRAVQLARYASQSPALAKIIFDYHWLELALSEQAIALEIGTVAKNDTSLDTLAAMQFAQMTVEVYRAISRKGQNALLGRIRDSLKASGLVKLSSLLWMTDCRHTWHSKTICVPRQCTSWRITSF